jgi:nitrogen-specific signal transduction histidine kinase
MNQAFDLDGIAMLQALPDGVLVADQQHIVRWVNPVAARLLNVDAETLLNTPLPPELTAVRVEPGQRALTVVQGRVLRVETVILPQHGKHYQGWNLITLRDQAHDVVQHWNDDAVAMLAFELRAPLTAVIGASELLQAGVGLAVRT